MRTKDSPSIEESIDKALGTIGQRLERAKAERRLNAAAPAMLEVLKAIVDCYLHTSDGLDLDRFGLILRAEAVIAKAEGHDD